MPVASSSFERTQECMVMAGITSQAQSAYVNEDAPHPESDELAASQQSQGGAAKSTTTSRHQAAHPAQAQGPALEDLFDAPLTNTTTTLSASTTTVQQSAFILDEHAPYHPDALELTQQEHQHFQDLQYHTKGGEKLVSTHPPVRGGAHKPSARKSHKQGSASVSSAPSAVAGIATTSGALLPAKASVTHLHPPSASPRRHSDSTVKRPNAGTSQCQLSSGRARSADAPAIDVQDSQTLASSSSSIPLPAPMSKKRKMTPNPGTELVEDNEVALVAAKSKKGDELASTTDADQVKEAQAPIRQQDFKSRNRRGSSHRSATPALRLSDIQDEGESQEPRNSSTAAFQELLEFNQTQVAIEGRHASQVAQSPKPPARESTPPTSSPPQLTRDQSNVDASANISPGHLSNDIASSETTPPPGEKRKSKEVRARPEDQEQAFPRLAEDEDEDEEDDEGADSEAYIAATLTASQHRVRASQVGQKLPPRNESAPPARIVNERQPSTAHEDQGPEAVAETIRSRPSSQTSLPASASEQRESHASEDHDYTDQGMQDIDEQPIASSSSQRPKNQKQSAHPGSGWVKPATSAGKIDPTQQVLTSSSETESEDDETAKKQKEDEKMPPPLKPRPVVEVEPRQLRAHGRTQFKATGTAYEKAPAPTGKSGKATHPSPRRTAMQKAAQKASQSRAAFASSPDGKAKATRAKRSTTGSSEERVARRSSRHGGAPTLKSDEIFALKDFKECIKRGKAVIIHDGHVAYVGYDTIWLSENQEFAETQDAMADASGAYENTWQIIVYCRNCPKPPGRHMTQSDDQDDERPEPEGLNDDELKDWRFFEKKRRQGYPESSCAAKVIFELRLNTQSYNKSTWVLRSRADHCMECISNESNVGLGQPDYEKAREDYYATAEAQWESKLDTLLKITKSFKKPPVIDDSGYNLASNSFLADIEAEEDQREVKRKKSKSSSRAPLDSVPRHASEELADDEEDAPRTSTPKGVKRKRPEDPLPNLPDDNYRTSTPIVSDSVAGEDEQELEEEKPEFDEGGGHMEDHHGADFDHLMDHFESQSHNDPGPDYDPEHLGDFPIQHTARSSVPPEPTPRTKRQKVAKAAAPAHTPASPPSTTPPPPPKRSDRLSKKGAAVSPKNGRLPSDRNAAKSASKITKREKATRAHPSGRLELEPETLLSDLELDESVQTVLDALNLETLADLHAATRGNSRIFQHDMDVTVEDLLLLATSQQAMRTYHSNHKRRQQDEEKAMLVHGLEYDGEEELRGKPLHTRRLVAILKNAKVLTRAMQAIDWSAEA